MAWTVTQIKLDEDKDNVGQATVVWNLGQQDEFQYSARCEVTLQAAQVFKANAEAARDAAIAKATQEANLAPQLEGVMNGN